MNSCEKGKRGEREWVRWLREHLEAETVSRGFQGAGGHTDPDVKGLIGWWCEVKRVERFSVWDVLKKLTQDVFDSNQCRQRFDDDHGPYDKPMVAFRRNRGKWWVILRAVDWAGLIRAVEEAERPRKMDPARRRRLTLDDWREAVDHAMEKARTDEDGPFGPMTAAQWGELMAQLSPDDGSWADPCGLTPGNPRWCAQDVGHENDHEDEAGLRWPKTD